VLRFLLWRLLGMLAGIVGIALVAWLLGGGLGQALRGSAKAGSPHSPLFAIAGLLARQATRAWSWAPAFELSPTGLPALLCCAAAAALGMSRLHCRRRRRYVRLQIDPYRTDRASPEALVTMFESLHKRLLRRWWRRLLSGQPAVTLEVHHSGPGATAVAWLAITCPQGFAADRRGRAAGRLFRIVACVAHVKRWVWRPLFCG